jgi:hypothetical protein
MSSCHDSRGREKKRWATAQAAKFVASYREFKTGIKHRAYHCPDCGKWHTTTKRNRWKRDV